MAIEKEKFYQERERHRKEIWKNLPLNLQLEFPLKRPERENGRLKNDF
jgi:hypothetical protein